MTHAREELTCLNVEIKRLATWIIDEQEALEVASRRFKGESGIGRHEEGARETVDIKGSSNDNDNDMIDEVFEGTDEIPKLKQAYLECHNSIPQSIVTNTDSTCICIFGIAQMWDLCCLANKLNICLESEAATAPYHQSWLYCGLREPTNLNTICGSHPHTAVIKTLIDYLPPLHGHSGFLVIHLRWKGLIVLQGAGPVLTYRQRQLARQTALSNCCAINADVDNVLDYMEEQAKQLSVKHKRGNRRRKKTRFEEIQAKIKKLNGIENVCKLPLETQTFLKRKAEAWHAHKQTAPHANLSAMIQDSRLTLDCVAGEHTSDIAKEFESYVLSDVNVSITGDAKATMQYYRYEKLIVAEKGVELINWPDEIPFINALEIGSMITPWRLFTALTLDNVENQCHWVKLSEEDWDKRCEASYEVEATKGPRKRKRKQVEVEEGSDSSSSSDAEGSNPAPAKKSHKTTGKAGKENVPTGVNGKKKEATKGKGKAADKAKPSGKKGKGSRSKKDKDAAAVSGNVQETAGANSNVQDTRPLAPRTANRD
ncbi:hypothetical protein K439DRAFT_1533580 [Ramaria rubella]|nr:hypothetical protein K439DRAFT_1533580 [Ramaria rubella]